MITGKNYIGNLLSSLGTVKFKTFNPKLNKENEVEFSEASEAEINKAASLAAEAFKQYRHFSGAQKGEFLNEIVKEIELLDELLINTYCLESGLPKERAVSERERTLFQLRSFADLLKEGSWVEATIETADKNRKPTPKPDLRKMNIPLGPVAVFGASNFPLAYSTAGGDTASALASGCPVIVKSHPMHAGTGELVASAIIKAAEKTGMPNGVFSNLNSSGIEVGTALVKNKEIKAVGFTGSLNGGRALFDLASKREEPIPVFAEMGSINPILILPEALKKNANKWAKTYADSITLGSGQFCTNPGLIIGIESSNLNDFINKLEKEIIKIEPSCMLHPHIVNSYERKKDEMLQQNDVKKVGTYTKFIAPNYGRQALITVEGSTFLKNSTLHQEVFGPFSVIVQCKNKGELSLVLASLEGQLTGTVIGEKEELKKNVDLLSQLQNRVGRMIINGVPTGVEVCTAMVHGGPYPASTDSRFTAVGVNSIKRWIRPFSFQNYPNELLPLELKNENPLKISRLVDGKTSEERI